MKAILILKVILSMMILIAIIVNGKILTGKKIKETNEMQMLHEAKKVKQM